MEPHILTVLIPKSDYANLLLKSRLEIGGLLILLMFFGVVCCLFYTRRYFTPILEDIDHVTAAGGEAGNPFFEELHPIYYRKEAAKRSSTYTIAMEEIEACIADPNTVEAEIEARELARIIESFLDTLTVENRVIFMRRYWFSDSCKDIAEFVGLSEKNISVRLTRIRQKMKSYLAEREVFV